MSKRRNENGQMRREEYEAEDDEITSESFEKGFQRASEESIRQRKIVKARVGGPMSRPSAAPKPSAAATTSSTATSAAEGAANPFSGFQGLTAGAPAAPKANPFAGFSGLTADKPAPTGFGTLPKPMVSTPPATPVVSAFGGSSSSAAAPKTASSSYQEAIEVLNKDFLSFVNDQARQNPSVSWIAAVQEYVKYADEIAAKHASTKPVPIDQQQQTKSAAPSFTSTPSFLTSTPTNGSAKSPVLTSGFSFGAKSDDKNAESKSVPAATNSGFSFGAAKKDDDAKPASTGGFSFGVAKKDDDSKPASTGGFSFGVAKKDDDSKPATSTGSFSFGATKKDDSSKSASTGGFSFGAIKKDDAKPAASTDGFSFGSSKPDADKAPTVTPAFSFSNLASSSSSAPAPATKPFSFGSSGASSFGTSAGASSAAAPAANDDDDENIGREEATVIIKSDSPDDDAVFDVEKAKVFEFKKDEKRWADKGLHPLKVLVNKSTKKARILVRNEIGKIVLNSSLYKGMSVKAHETKGKKTGVIVSLQVADAMTQYLLKVNAAKVDEFIAALEKAAMDS